MSHLVVPKEGALVLENYLSGHTAGLGSITRLFKASIVSSQNRVLADFTEATFTGYAKVINATWGAAATDGAGKAAASTTACVFQATADLTPTQTIYGYYVTDDDGSPMHNSTVCLWYEIFDTPVVLSFNGDRITITPKLTLVSENLT